MREIILLREESNEVSSKSRELNTAETALRYALLSMVGAWIGFLSWAPHPDLLVSQTIKSVQTLVK